MLYWSVVVKTEFTVKVKLSICCSSNIPIPTMCPRPRSLVIEEWLSVDLLLLLNFKTKQSRWFSQVQLGGSKSRTCRRDYVSLLECLCVKDKKLERSVWSLSILINIYIYIYLIFKAGPSINYNFLCLYFYSVPFMVKHWSTLPQGNVPKDDCSQIIQCDSFLQIWILAVSIRRYKQSAEGCTSSPVK